MASLPFNAPPPDHAAYAARAPFAHLVIDNFLASETAEAAAAAFPDSANDIWKSHGRNYQKDKIADKYEMTKYQQLHPALQKVVDIVNGPEFTAYLNTLTGFDDLTPDMTLNGGGLNMVKPGGFLRTHADFNWSNELNAYRTVNVLYYLNKGWKKEWGGCLELWEQDMTSCAHVIEPEFNRLAIFTTFNTSFHGYKKVETPDNRTRNSFNFYFYRKDAAPGIEKAPHKTLWRYEEGA
jgi:Rps23 Pro-64 3,4-dihydroxylase Tpa1-like proline 4-hydroxylase